MRKTLALLASLMLCFLLVAAGCGDDDDDNDNNDDADDDVSDDDVSDDDVADDDVSDDDVSDDDVSDDDVTDDDVTDDDVTDDDTTDDDDTTGDDDDDDTTELFNIDFEDYAIGDLPAPWVVVENGNSFIDIINDPTVKTGKVLEVAGADFAGNSASATYPISQQPTGRVVISYKVYVPGDGSAFIQLNQDDAVRIGQLNMWGENHEVQFDYFQNWTLCGSFSGDTWYNVRLELDLGLKTVDVYFNNVLTSCSDTPLNPTQDFTYLGQFLFIDHGGEGESGVPYFDNFSGYQYN